MSLSRIRSRIEALERKFALPLAAVKLRPLAEEFCNECEAARAEEKPLPQAHPFIQRLVGKGFQFSTFTSLSKYIKKCHDKKEPPEAYEIVSTLLSRAYKLSLVYNLFQMDAATPA